MTMKLFRAYRVKGGVDLGAFLSSVQERARRNLSSVLVRIYRHLLSDTELHAHMRHALGLTESEEIKPMTCSMYMKKLYQDQLGQARRGLFDLDVWIDVITHEGRTHIVPQMERRSFIVNRCLDFLEADERVEDFAYFNNADKPKDISEGEWLERGKTWTGIYKAVDEGKAVFLFLDICSIRTFDMVDPAIDLVMEMHGETGEVPI